MRGAGVVLQMGHFEDVAARFNHIRRPAAKRLLYEGVASENQQDNLTLAGLFQLIQDSCCGSGRF
jgi:hypothetical protein